MALLSSAIQYGTHAARPTAGIAGRLYGESDTGDLFRDNGATWDQLATTGGGGAGATDANGVTAPPTSGWSWTNQGSATVTNAADGLWLSCPADSSDVFKCYMRTATAPYDVVAEIETLLPAANFASGGLFVNKSGVGLAGILYVYNSGVELGIDSGDTTHMTTNLLTFGGSIDRPRWFKIHVPASGNLLFSTSVDGLNWLQIYSGASSYAGAETAGIGINPRNGTYPAGLLLRSWSAA